MSEFFVPFLLVRLTLPSPNFILTRNALQFSFNSATSFVAAEHARQARYLSVHGYANSSRFRIQVNHKYIKTIVTHVFPLMNGSGLTIV
jgi:hypothetical protein